MQLLAQKEKYTDKVIIWDSVGLLKYVFISKKMSSWGHQYVILRELYILHLVFTAQEYYSECTYAIDSTWECRLEIIMIIKFKQIFDKDKNLYFVD